MALLLLFAGGAAVFQRRKCCAARRVAAGGHAQSEATSAGEITVHIDGAPRSSLNGVELGAVIDTSRGRGGAPIGAADPPPAMTACFSIQHVQFLEYV